jgi:iron-sulfur cluster repair protein YtfE (RIC family)
MTKTTKLFAEEHDVLRGRLEALLRVADSVGVKAPASLRADLDSIERFLHHDLLPHAMAEETVLYPALGGILCGTQATSTMRRDHEEIRRLIGELDSLKSGRLPMHDASWDVALRRVLYSLYAVVRLHFSKEEEIFLPVAEEQLGHEKPRELFDAMEGVRAQRSAESHREARASELPERARSGDEVMIGSGEIEGTRLLANEAGRVLNDAGLSDEEVLRLAEQFITIEGESDPREFVAWAEGRRRLEARKKA